MLRRLAAPLRVWRRLAGFVERDRWLLVAIGATSVVRGFGEAALLYLLVQAATAIASGTSASVDVAWIHLDEVGTTAMLQVGFALLVLLAAVAGANAVSVAAITSRTLNRTRRLLVDGFLDAAWAVQSREPEGRLQQVLHDHVLRVGVATLQVCTGLGSALTFLAYMASAVAVDPAVALVVLVGVTAVGGVLVPLNRASRRVAQQNLDLSVRYGTEVAQAVRLARELRVFGVEEQAKHRLAERADAAERAMFTARFLARVGPSVYQYSALALVLVGLALVDGSGAADAGALGAIVLLLVRALTYGQQLSAASQQIAEQGPFIEAVRELQTRYAGEAVARGGEDASPRPELRLDGVGFEYEPGQPVLHDVSFTVAPGEALGIVGPSGSGKSTLLQVLLRLREPSIGRFLVDGEDAVTIGRHTWHSIVSFVPQDNVLLAGTVSENIRFLRAGIDDDAVVDAAKAAQLHDEVLALPDGYDTVIGAGATDLSGGQRQRLGLARALVGRPSVLVLDEPTSALDLRSERLIQRTLEHLHGSLTVIVVAHRISTLSICDRILVLEGGRVAAVGTAEEVLETSAFFRDATRLSQLRS